MSKLLPPTIYPFIVSALIISAQITNAQTVAITANPQSSGNIVIGPNAFHVSENIYTEEEIGAANFTTVGTAINHIDFSVFALGTVTSVDSFNIYLKEVPLTSTTFTAGAYSTTGYSLVFSGTFSASTIGWAGVDLATPFMRTMGNNLQLLIERRDSVFHGSFSFNATRGNSTDATLLSSRRINTAVKPVPDVTVLNSTSPFRPQIQLRHINMNDAAIAEVYTLGKLPIPFAAPHIISASIVNNGSNRLDNLAVSLNITGANGFTNVQNIASLAPGASVTVSFDAFNPVNTGFNTVTISVPPDDFANDNEVSIQQEVSANAYSYAYPGLPSYTVGLNNNTGDFVAMFTCNGSTSINQVGVNFGAGGQPFRIGIWDKSGNAAPGNLLWESADQISTTGVFTLPISPAVPIADTFYIGVRQIGTVNIQFSYQDETPIRPKTFFVTTPSGNTTWTDFAPANPFKFMIEPRLTLANDVGVATIINPVAASAIDNCGIVPQAAVSNFGSNDQLTPFDVTFNIKQTGAIVYSDTKQVTLSSGETQQVYFSPFAGSVSGTDSSFVFTSLAGDAAANNDTVINRFTTGVFSFSDSTTISDGYSFANSTRCASMAPLQPEYNWITQTDNFVDWGDDGDDSVLATPISLPFPFKFFGNTYNEFWISSNGWISFTNPDGMSTVVQRTPVAIPAAGGIENYIAGILTDLDNTESIFADAKTYYGADAGQFVITFWHAHLFGSDDYITFQILLKVNGDIMIQYNDAESTSPAVTSITNFCSVGIENANGTRGTRYRLNGSGGSIFGSPLALQFYARPTPPVPVTMVEFTVIKNKQVNMLHWATIQEINSREFVIERSDNGVDFTAIGNVSAAGQSNGRIQYSFSDVAPIIGKNYYRLRMTDANNHTEYSAIKMLINEKRDELFVYPNPVKEKMNLVFNADKAGEVQLSLCDVNGTVLYNHIILATKGYNNTTVDIGTLPQGYYILKLQLQARVISGRMSKM